MNHEHLRERSEPRLPAQIAKTKSKSTLSATGFPPLLDVPHAHSLDSNDLLLAPRTIIPLQLLLRQPPLETIHQLHPLVDRLPLLRLPSLNSVHRQTDEILSVDSVPDPETGRALEALFETEAEDVGGFAGAGREVTFGCVIAEDFEEMLEEFLGVC